MSLVCVASVRGSPGATTLALCLGSVWPRPVVVVEADPDGGVLAARYGLGREPGLAGLAAELRGGAPTARVVWENAQRLPGGLAAVVAHERGEVASSTLAAVGGRLASWCGAVEGFDVVADCGRLRPGSPAEPLVAAADALLVAARPRPDELFCARQSVLGAQGGQRVAGLVLVGERPHGADEVREQLRLPVVGVVADDPRGARLLAEGGSSRGLRVSALMRSVRTLTEEIGGQLEPVTPDTAPELEPAAPSRGWSEDILRALRADARAGMAAPDVGAATGEAR